MQSQLTKSNQLKVKMEGIRNFFHGVTMMMDNLAMVKSLKLENAFSTYQKALASKYSLSKLLVVLLIHLSFQVFHLLYKLSVE